MDALALLCTLYAEGPSTLQRLRSGGCDSLSGLLETDSEGLQASLGWDERLSERFLREAWILAERLDVGWSDEEEIGVTTQIEAPHSKREPSSTVASSRVKGGASSSLREKLLSRWRDLDRDEPPMDPDLNPASVRKSGLSGSSGAIGSREPVLDADALDPGLLALGLSAPQLSRLKAKGIESRAALISTETLALASLLGVPYTRAQRQQLLAKRVEQEQSQPTTHNPIEGLVPSPTGDQRLDAAGPFA